MTTLLFLLAACGSDRATTIAGLTGDSATGATLFVDNGCNGCHADDASGGTGPALAGIGADDTDAVNTVIDGDGDMPSFTDLSDQDIADLFAWISEQ